VFLDLVVHYKFWGEVADSAKQGHVSITVDVLPHGVSSDSVSQLRFPTLQWQEVVKKDDTHGPPPKICYGLLYQPFCQTRVVSVTARTLCQQSYKTVEGVL